MGALFSGPPKPPPTPPPAPVVQAQQDQAAVDAANKERISRNQRGAANQTLNSKTGFLGVDTTLGSP